MTADDVFNKHKKKQKIAYFSKFQLTGSIHMNLLPSC